MPAAATSTASVAATSLPRCTMKPSIGYSFMMPSPAALGGGDRSSRLAQLRDPGLHGGRNLQRLRHDLLHLFTGFWRERQLELRRFRAEFRVGDHFLECRAQQRK